MFCMLGGVNKGRKQGDAMVGVWPQANEASGRCKSTHCQEKQPEPLLRDGAGLNGATAGWQWQRWRSVRAGSCWGGVWVQGGEGNRCQAGRQQGKGESLLLLGSGRGQHRYSNH